jgi:hypothetical protein
MRNVPPLNDGGQDVLALFATLKPYEDKSDSR